MSALTETKTEHFCWECGTPLDGFGTWCGCGRDVVVIPPAPGDVEITIAEHAMQRSYTIPGGFAALRAAALAGAPDDHEPFPLVRRRVPR